MRSKIVLLSMLAVAPASADDDPPPPELPGDPEPAPAAAAPVDPGPQTPDVATTTLTSEAHTTGMATPRPTERFLIGGKLGGIVPFGGLSPFVSVGIELGVVLPVADRRLAIVVDVDYTQPTSDGNESDGRVTGGTYAWQLTVQELAIMPVVMYRMTSLGRIVPYGGIGPRILLARSTVESDGEPTIMETHESSTKIGVGVPLGAELVLGPGRAIGEILLQYGALDHVATGDSNSGAVSASVGYRLIF